MLGVRTGYVVRIGAAVFVGLVLLSAAFAGTAAADAPDAGNYSAILDGMDGTGTADSPYQITNATELQAVAGDLGANYTLAGDIDASATSSWNNGAGFDPIGNDSTSFSGTFNGNGYAITGLFINRYPPGQYGPGLFGMTTSAALIENVGLEDANVSRGAHVGGLVGWNYGTINSSYVTGNVSGSSKYVGGLVGLNEGGTVMNSHAAVAVGGSGDRVGGLVGHNQGGIVEESYATGTVNGSSTVGGLVGQNGGEVENSYATSDVTGNDAVGGLVGYTEQAHVTSSYATGNVTGSNTVGGLVGSGSDISVDGYWDVNTTGQDTSAGGTGLTTDQLKGNESLAGFDYTSTWAVYNASQISYPYLQANTQTPAPGLESVSTSANFEVTIADTNASVTAGGDVVVDATVENTGGESGTQIINLTVNGTTEASRSVSLNDGETTTETFTYATSSGDTPAIEVGVESENDTATQTVSVTAPDPYAGGSGTESDPYEIANWYHLNNTRLNLDANFTLVADLNESTSGYDDVASETANGGNGFLPIGAEDAAFNGSFRGNGRTVTGLYIDRSRDGADGTGLFGRTGSEVLIEDVSLEDADVSNSNNRVGGLVGWNQGGTVRGSSATGAVSGGVAAGGLVGDNGGTVSESHATMNVSGDTSVGGLIGSNSGNVNMSYATGSVSGSNVQVGGLIGYNDFGTVNVSYSTGNVSGDVVGGLVGRNDFGTVSKSYATGKVTASSTAGGLVGDNRGTVTNSYWNIETTRQNTSDGGAGLTTSEMTGADSESNMNFPFGTTWGVVDNSTHISYPYLQDNTQTPAPGLQSVSTSGPYAGGSGAESDPYQITNWYHLNNTRQNLDANFTLVADLNASSAGYDDVASDTSNSGNGFDPIGDSPTAFTGSFDGDNHTITGLYIDRARPDNDGTGLFGNTGSGAVIEDVGLEDADVSNAKNRVGALVGNNTGTVNSAYATGTVSGSGKVGGLVGDNGGTVDRSYATGNVSGGDWVGGLIGSNFDGPIEGDGTVRRSYATGTVSGDTEVGGLVGDNLGTVTGGYWDVNTTDQADGIGKGSGDVTGLTTSEMKGDPARENMSAFDFTATWDVVDEDLSGGRQVSYPFLRDNQQDPAPGLEQLGADEGDKTDEQDCLDRRSVSRGQESQECPTDRDLSRGGSREELDRNTGRNSDTRRRDRSRRNRGR